MAADFLTSAPEYGRITTRKSGSSISSIQANYEALSGCAKGFLAINRSI